MKKTSQKELKFIQDGEQLAYLSWNVSRINVHLPCTVCETSSKGIFMDKFSNLTYIFNNYEGIYCRYFHQLQSMVDFNVRPDRWERLKAQCTATFPIVRPNSVLKAILFIYSFDLYSTVPAFAPNTEWKR